MNALLDTAATERDGPIERKTTNTPTAFDLDGDKLRDGVGGLVLTVVRLVHELLERQAIRRMDAGTLTEDEIDRLGLALMRQSEEIDTLCDEFGIDREDLNLDLGPLGRLI